MCTNESRLMRSPSSLVSLLNELWTDSDIKTSPCKGVLVWTNPNGKLGHSIFDN